MKTKFILKEPKAKEPTLIYVSLNHNYKKYKYSTGLTIEPRFWNPKEGLARKNYHMAAEVNENLACHQQALEKAYLSLLNEGQEIDRAGLTERYRKQLVPTLASPRDNGKGKKGFLDIIDEITKLSKSGNRLNNGILLSAPTISSYVSTRKHLKDFEDALGEKLMLQDFSMSMYNRFVEFTNSQGKSANTLGFYTKYIKVFAHWAKENGHPVHPDIESKRFKVIREAPETVALTMKELERIAGLDLSGNKLLEPVRDYFIMDCYLGLRFKDLCKVDSTYIIDGQRIEITTSKTTKKVVIPLKPAAKEIIERYDGSKQRIKHSTSYNKRIKDVCRLAGITEKVKVTRTKGGSRVQTEYEKWELVSAHTARRTFATILYLDKMDILTIMSMTGHKNIKDFLRYIRVDAHEHANRAATHPFFTT